MDERAQSTIDDEGNARYYCGCCGHPADGYFGILPTPRFPFLTSVLCLRPFYKPMSDGLYAKPRPGTRVAGKPRADVGRISRRVVWAGDNTGPEIGEMFDADTGSIKQFYRDFGNGNVAYMPNPVYFTEGGRWQLATMIAPEVASVRVRCACCSRINEVVLP